MQIVRWFATFGTVLEPDPGAVLQVDGDLDGGVYSGAGLLREFGQGVHNLADRAVVVFVIVFLFGTVVYIVRDRGPRVCFLAPLYIIHLVVLALTLRWLVGPGMHYEFPALISVLHYVTTWIAVAGYWVVKQDTFKLFPSSVGQIGDYLTKMAPIGVSLPLSVIFNNKSLIFIGAGLCMIIGTLSPICTAIVSRMFGRRLSFQSWLGVMVVFVGVFLVALAETHDIRVRRSLGDLTAVYTQTGIVFAVLALLLRVLRIVLQDMLTAPFAYFGSATKRVPISGMHMLAAQSPVVVFVALLFTLATENLGQAWRQLTPTILAVLLLTCVIATSMNILCAVLLQDCGATFVQITGKLNAIVTMSVSIVFLGEKLVVGVLLGSGVILAGVAIFESGQIEQSKQLETLERVFPGYNRARAKS